MKISYILQLKDFAIMFFVGMILGLIYGLVNTFHQIKPNVIIRIISDLIFSILTFVTFIFTVNIINCGQIRLFLLVGFLLGLLIERITLGKIFAKGFRKLYNIIVKLLKKFAKSKLGRIILK